LINEQTKLKDKILIFEEIFAANKNPVEYMNDYFNMDNPGFIFICKTKFIELLIDEDFNFLYLQS
jgi:hypothetical protein